jgi:hypothetical protein
MYRVCVFLLELLNAQLGPSYQRLTGIQQMSASSTQPFGKGMAVPHILPKLLIK